MAASRKERLSALTRIAVSLAAVGLIGYSLYLAKSSNFNFGPLTVYVLSLLATVWAVFFGPINRFLLETLPGRLVLGALALALLGLAFLVAFINRAAYAAPPTGREQAIVVLGAGLRGDQPSRILRCRLDRAYRYWQENPGLLIVTTGGQGLGETIPEGEAEKRYLLSLGVPEESILAETDSTSTEENFAFAKTLLEERGFDLSEGIVVVTNTFHCYRGRQYAAMAGFQKVASLAAPTPPTARIPCYLREAAALVYYWLFRSSRTGFLHPLAGMMKLNKELFYRLRR